MAFGGTQSIKRVDVRDPDDVVLLGNVDREDFIVRVSVSVVPTIDPVIPCLANEAIFRLLVVVGVIVPADVITLSGGIETERLCKLGSA